MPPWVVGGLGSTRGSALDLAGTDPPKMTLVGFASSASTTAAPSGMLDEETVAPARLTPRRLVVLGAGAIRTDQT